MTTAITPLSQATFLVVRVSDRKQEFTNARNDGTQFISKKWGLTLMPTLESGFTNDVSWTLWTSSDEVADAARALIEMPEKQVINDDGSVKVIREPRLALLNGIRDFKYGEAKPNKDPNYRDNVTVWLDGGCEPDFGIVEMPRSKDAGNIRSLMSSLGITTKPEKAESVKPASGDNAPF